MKWRSSDSGVIFWTYQNSFATQLTDNRLHQLKWSFWLCLSKWAECRAKAGFRNMLKDFELKSCSSLFHYYIKQIDSMLPCVCSVIDHGQKMSKCGKNISDTLGYHLVCHLFVLTTFWRHLWPITEQMHSNMASMKWMLLVVYFPVTLDIFSNLYSIGSRRE